MFHTGGNGTESNKQEVRFTLDFIGSNALLRMVEIRGVEPLTFSMPLVDGEKAQNGVKRREAVFTGSRGIVSPCLTILNVRVLLFVL